MYPPSLYLGKKKVSCLERCPYISGVLIEGFHCIQQEDIIHTLSIVHFIAGLVFPYRTGKTIETQSKD